MSNREWYRGAELPALVIWWEDSQGTLIDFSGADTFEARIGKVGCPALLVKTTGIVGTTGVGVEPSGTPNIRIEWAADDLDLEPGLYTLTIVVTFGAQDRMMATTIRILDVVADPDS